MYSTRQRKIIKAVNAEAVSGTEIIERKWITKLLYQSPEKVKGITVAQIECVVKQYPIIGKLYGLIRSFKDIMLTNQVPKLGVWLKTASMLAIDEINSFINGIMSDLDAVKNSIRFEI